MAIATLMALIIGLTFSSPVWALSISQAYLLGDWSSPTTTSVAPFPVTGASGFRLSLNSSGVATSATAVGGLTAQITDRLYYQSNTGVIDPNEVSPSSLASRVNNELAKLDDVGVISPEADAALNIDFTSGASVMLRTLTPTVAVTGLVIFEDAGLDPFSLRYCYNTACTQSDLLFDGFNTSTTSTILASSAFGTDDVAPGIDQAFYFVFNQAATGGYFRISDTQNFGGLSSERLEVDYAGITTARVPTPGTLLLLAEGMIGLIGFSLLRKAQSC